MEANNKRKIEYFDYVSGNTARKLNAVPERDYNTYRNPNPRVVKPRQTQTRRPVQKPVRNPSVGRGIDFGSLVFLLAAMSLTLYVCFSYLRAQSDAVQLGKEIQTMETKLSKLMDQNNALEASINKPVDLDEIYRIAVGELGMVHPNKNEVITYESSDSGYVRQYGDIPSSN